MFKVLLRNAATMQPSIRMNSSSSNPFIFKQLIDNQTFTFTYLLADAKTKDAIIIDPVYEKVDRDLKFIKELDLNVLYAINTHVHADHITGSGKLKKHIKSMKSVLGIENKGKADIFVKEGDTIKFGNQQLSCISTPGHTSGCISLISHNAKLIFTGDALFVRGCGRTDFQSGSSEKLYDSIHKKIFTLPDEYNIYPGHDYNGFTSSTVGEEKRFNPRLTKTKSDFADTMNKLQLPHPNLIAIAVPANLICGLIDEKQ